MKYKPLALAAAALVASGLAFGNAQAANLMTGGGAMPDIATSQDPNIQQVSHHWHHHGSSVFLGLGFGFPGFYQPYYYDPYPYYYRPYYYRPYYYRPYYYRPYYYQSYSYAPVRSRHVRYCLNRYRTYNMRTNTFRGYDGYLHRCRSPYRY